MERSAWWAAFAATVRSNPASSVTTETRALPTAAPRSAKWPTTVRRATTATSARAPTSVRRGLAAERRWCARRSTQCHDAGICNPGTGVCSNPAKADGTSCSDGNACTQTDTCKAGACMGGSPVVCAASDQCHDSRHVQSRERHVLEPTRRRTAHRATTATRARKATRARPERARARTRSSALRWTSATTRAFAIPPTGACSIPRRPTELAATTATRARKTDTCQAGKCTGAQPGEHAPRPTSATIAGTCNPANGACSNPAKANGRRATTATRARRPTRAKRARAPAAIRSRVPRSISATIAGICDTATGTLLEPGQSRTARRATTATRARRPIPASRARAPARARWSAPRSDQCHVAGTCNPANGRLLEPGQGRRATCSDGNACTQTDTCQAGICVGGNPVTCLAQDQCHDRRHLQSEQRRLLQPSQERWRPLHRWQCLHAGRRLSGRHLYRNHAGRLCSARSVPRRRSLRSTERNLHQPGPAGWHRLRRQHRVHP